MTKKEITIKDIAEATNFSSATVSRVLNNDPKFSVSDETRKIIFKTASELGYRRKTILPIIDNVAFLYWIEEKEELEDIYFKELRMNIQRHAKNKNVRLDLYHKEDGIEALPNSLSAYIVVGSLSDDEIRRLDQISPNGIFVDMNPNPDKYDCVKTDLAHIVEDAYTKFYQSGHRKIAFVGGTYVNPNNNQDEEDIRETAFRQIAEEYQTFDESLVYIQRGLTVSSGKEIMKKMIADHQNLPTAIITASDSLAIGALQVMNDQGIKVPDDIEIVGINNVNVSKYVSPPLTTYGIHLDEIAKNIINLLMERIVEDRKIAKTIVVSSHRINRKSTY